MADKRIYAVLKSFSKGQNSDIDPLLLPPDQISFSLNATVRGNFVKQRPAFLGIRLLYTSPQVQADFQTGLFQGSCYYRNNAGFIMSAVGGNLFQIAINGDGTATVSEITVPVPSTEIYAPNVPTSLVASAGNGQVVLTWSASAVTSGYGDATGYTVWRSTTSGAGYVKITPAAITSTTYTDTGLTNGTIYYYVIQATNNVGNSAYSAQASATPAAAGSVPGTPAGLSATAGSLQIVLSWTPTAGAASYSIYRSLSSGGTYTQVATTNTAGYTDSTVSNGTAYYYKITATNGYGTSGYSSIVNATPLATAPSAPTGLMAAAGAMQVSLAWTAVSGMTYNVLRSTTNGSGYTSLATGLLAANYLDVASLVVGTMYYYVVQAVNANGTSGNSSQVNTTTNLIPNGSMYSQTSGFFTINISANTQYTLLKQSNDQFWGWSQGGPFIFGPNPYVIPSTNTNTTLNLFEMNMGSVTAVLSRQ
jgi:fibronectin type 3 domain-containing protein